MKKNHSTLKSLWSQRSADSLTQEALIDQIFKNLNEVMRQSDIFPKHYFVSGMLQGEQKAQADMWRASVRSALNDLFADDEYGPVARLAIDMNKGALDKCCKIIVENFLDYEAMTSDSAVEAIRDIINEKHAHIVSPDAQESILENVRASFPAYQALKYLAAAGPVFGFPIDETLEADIQKQRDHLINAAIDQGINSQQGPKTS